MVVLKVLTISNSYYFTQAKTLASAWQLPFLLLECQCSFRHQKRVKVIELLLLLMLQNSWKHDVNNKGWWTATWWLSKIQSFRIPQFCITPISISVASRPYQLVLPKICPSTAACSLAILSQICHEMLRQKDTVWSSGERLSVNLKTQVCFVESTGKA